MNYKSFYEKHLAHNLSYKLVSLFVSLVLWVTLLGRTDLVSNHTMELQLLTNPNHVVVNQVPRTIKVKVSGPRAGLKKFTQSEQILTLNLEKLEPGTKHVKIEKGSINVPVGVKIISVLPNRIRVRIRELKE